MIGEHGRGEGGRARGSPGKDTGTDWRWGWRTQVSGTREADSALRQIATAEWLRGGSGMGAASSRRGREESARTTRVGPGCLSLTSPARPRPWRGDLSPPAAKRSPTCTSAVAAGQGLHCPAGVLRAVAQLRDTPVWATLEKRRAPGLDAPRVAPKRAPGESRVSCSHYRALGASPALPPPRPRRSLGVPAPSAPQSSAAPGPRGGRGQPNILSGWWRERDRTLRARLPCWDPLSSPGVELGGRLAPSPRGFPSTTFRDSWGALHVTPPSRPSSQKLKGAL